jgi:predicted ABC-type ATPase
MTKDEIAFTVLTDRQIDAAAAALIRSKFLHAGLTPGNPPTLYAMAGIPGSGKSGFVDTALKDGRYPANALLVDPDRVMQLIPDYLRDLADRGSETAFQNWELPTRAYTYGMLDEAIRKRFNIVQDMGMVRRENLNRVKQMKELGYRFEMTYLYCPASEAIRRLEYRARHTAAEMVIEREATLNVLLPEYVAIADTFTVSDPALPFQPSSLEKIAAKK